VDGGGDVTIATNTTDGIDRVKHPAYRKALCGEYVIAATGQYHGCTDCGKLTWHRREQRGNVTVLKCTECEKGRNP